MGTQERKRRPIWPVVALLIGSIGAATWALTYRGATQRSGSSADGGSAGSDRLGAAGLPPLPFGFRARPRELVEEAYQFAARHPEVLKYLPCFCGCERRGHRSNLDCFVASRSPSGEVTWAAHGMG